MNVRALAGVIAVLVGACIEPVFSPNCTYPELGQLASPVWGEMSTTGTDLIVVSADFEEKYCGPFVTRFVAKDRAWQAVKQTALPEVSVGQPAMPATGFWSSDGTVWISDRRGRRLLAYDLDSDSIHAVSTGRELSRMTVRDDGSVLFGADATRPGWMVYCSNIDSSRAACEDVELETDKSISALAVSQDTLYIGYAQGNILSRYLFRDEIWLAPLTPSAGLRSLEAVQLRFLPGSGDLLLLIPADKRLAILESAADYRIIRYSLPLGLPARSLILDDGSILVHDRLYGDWLLDEYLTVTAAVEGSPDGLLTLWQPRGDVGPRAATVLSDKELQTW